MGCSSARRVLLLAIVLSSGCGRLDYERASLMGDDAGPMTRDAARLDAGTSAHDAGMADDAGEVSDAGTAGEDGGPLDAGGSMDAGDLVDGGFDAGRAACPADTFLVAPATAAFYCIERNDRVAAPFETARTTCLDEGRHLCTDDEWRVGCDLGGAMFLDLADDWEWVDLLIDAATAKKRGYTCGDTSSHVIADPYPYRCCAPPTL